MQMFSITQLLVVAQGKEEIEAAKFSWLVEQAVEIGLSLIS